MANLSHLGSLNPVEHLELGDKYPAVKEKSSFRLAPKGVYSLQAPPEFPDTAFTRTKAGSLQITLDPTIVGPTNEGLLIKFQKVSSKVYDRSGQKASQVGDYLISCGFRGRLQNEQEIADAVEATASTVYQAKLDWRGYNKRTGWSLEGMEKFPKLADGTHQAWTIDPAEVGKDVNGQPIADNSGTPIMNADGTPRFQARVYANLYIPLNGFIPAV